MKKVNLRSKFEEIIKFDFEKIMVKIKDKDV